MNANVRKTNGVKLVAAVMIMAMVVAGAAVLYSDNGTDAADTTTFADTSNTQISENKTIVLNSTVTGPETISFSKAPGAAEDATYTVTVSMTYGTVGNATVNDKIMFDDVDITVGTGITLVLKLDAVTAQAANFGAHILQDVNLTIENGAKVEFQQTANAPGITYCSTSGTGNDLVLNGTGQLVFNGANGVSEINVTTNGTSSIQFNEASSSKVALGFRQTTIGQGTSVTMSDDRGFFYLNGNTTINGTLDAGSSRVQFTDNATNLRIEQDASLNGGEIVIPAGTTVTNNGSISGDATATTIEQAIANFAYMDEVTLESDAEVQISEPTQVPSNKILNIVNTTIVESAASTFVATGDAKILVVTGTLNLDNSYIFCGVYVDEEAGGIVNAINVHNLTSSGTMYDSTKVGFGDTLTLSGTVPSGVTVDVYGTLNASDVTINGVVNTYVGSTIGVTGSITVANQFNLNAGATMELSGTITVRNDATGGANFTLANSQNITYDVPTTIEQDGNRAATLNAALTVTADGTFNVNRATSNSAAGNPNALTIGNGAEFVVEGTLTITGQLSGIVQDKGNVTFNGTAAGDNTGIIMYDGVTLTVTSVTGKLTVSDSDAVLLDYYGVDAATDLADTYFSSGNQVILQNVRGVTVTEAVSESYSDDNETRYAVTNMTVTGSVSKVQSDSIAQGTLTINNACNDADASEDNIVKGTMSIVDSFAVGSKVQVTVQGPVAVDGTVNVIAENAVMTVDTGAELTVDGSITVSDETGTQFNINGTVNAMYYVITDATDATETYYYTSFAGAVDNIANADEDTVNVIGTVKVSADDEVPSGATVVVQGKLVIDTGVTLTFVDGAVLNITSSAKDAVDVNGTLVINNKDTGLSGNINNMSYDVYTLVGLVATYTSLANALADAEAGETITLSQNVTLDTSIVIPEGVTLQTGRYTVTVDDGVTITVNGTFAVQSGGNVVAALTSDSTDGADARYVWGDDVRIVVNGVMSDASTAITDLKTYYISGAYYTARGVSYVTGVDYAAENVHEGTVDIYGQISAGDMTFSSERGMTVNVKAFDGAGTGSVPTTTVTVGNVTIDNVELVIAAANVSFNGTVSAAAAEGTASVQLSRAAGISIESTSANTIDGAVDYLYIIGTGSATPATNVVTGTVNVSAGTVTVGAEGVTVSGEDSITVASGATLVVPAAATVTAGASGDEKTALTVAGTMNVAGNLDVAGKADISGTLNIAKTENGNDATVDVLGTMNVTGTVNVSTDENLAGKLIIGASPSTDGTLVVGSKPTVLGTAVSGTIAGNINAIIGDSIVKVYYGGSVDGVTYGTSGSVLADATALGNTVYYINETEYMTVYALTSNEVNLVGSGSPIASDMVGNTDNANLQLSGLNTTGANTYTNWFTDAEATNAISDDDNIGSADAIYMTAKASVLSGTVSAGTGLVIYIDNVAQGSGNDIKVSYGNHVVTIDVKVGYDGANATITFNGQTIQSGDTITVTEDGFTLTATGATPADLTGGSTTGGSSDDGLGLTDYLLIILVVLIVIMAIMVAMRLMRS